MADTMPLPAPPHPVRLTGLRRHAADRLAPPLLVERRDQDFVAGLLADLARPERHAVLRETQSPRRENAVLRLFPPVQRVFNLAVFETWCDVPGTPRLDAAKIDGAGLVLRKLVDGEPRAWIQAGTRFLGWRRIDESVDPAADKRAAALSLGRAALDRELPCNRLRRAAGDAELAALDVDVTEAVSPLFVAPPEVCRGAGRTLLFGHVPVAANEQAEADPAAPGYGSSAQERAQLKAHLFGFFRADSSFKPQHPGIVVDAAWAKRAQALPHGNSERADYELLTDVLRQAQLELDAFGDSAESQALFAQLQRIEVERDVTQGATVETRREKAGDFLRLAARVLFDGEPGASFVMPHRRAALAAGVADAFFEASLRALDAQHRKLGIGRGRFDAERDDEEPRYVLRAFLRLKPEHPGCAPRLLWSAYSEPFSIAPWYESAGAPPPLVPMPDLFDRKVLKRVKPGVAFALPPRLAKLVSGDPKKLRDGEGDPGDGLGLGWICSFSIPIITLCAFIVLSIFLSLLNLIFFWLPFLKICIPYPKKG